MKECSCEIEALLDKEETQVLKDLFRRLGKKVPPCEKLAKIKKWDIASTQCEHVYNWGFNFYCNCPIVIERFLKGE